MSVKYDILNLNGYWECGEERKYDRRVQVPGLASNPKEMNRSTLWYRKRVRLPEGDWTHSTLILNGARFCPSVYINGECVSVKNGGMAVTVHYLEHPSVKPGQTIDIEIALKSLKDVHEEDASRIPDADIWRSNISSGLWDHVSMKFHRDIRISRVIPSVDIKNNSVSIYWELEFLGKCPEKYSLLFQVMDQEGVVVAEARDESNDVRGNTLVKLNRKCRRWDLQEPVCYTLRSEAVSGDMLMDSNEMTLGLKEFAVEGLSFTLNHQPITLRAGTVVWQRWLRDPESGELAFDDQWFEKNIICRLKEHGANTIRFHLGTPPEKLLDLCDRHGMMVQIEWCFFHGMKASKESLIEQWRNWLDLCMRHPSVCVIHPWNETEDEELELAYEAVKELSGEYPPLVISHRDIIHLHLYWWSLFENINLYYDSASQFDKPIMVDEFGGNYLDGQGNPGLYPMVEGSLLRFLGRNHTREERLELNTLANARIAEYWRRIGAAGFSPFCILGSPEDGSHHFMGKLAEGNPKPVWEALTAAYSPLSVSLDVWDRNYLPGQTVQITLVFFNDTDEDRMLNSVLRVVSNEKHSDAIPETHVDKFVAAHETVKKDALIKLPKYEGEWRFDAVLLNPPSCVKYPVVSSWRFQTIIVKSIKAENNLRVGVSASDKEITALFQSKGLKLCPIDNEEANVIVTGWKAWEQLDDSMRIALKNAIDRNCSVIMLDIGPMELGTKYPKENDHVRLQNAFYSNQTITEELFDGIHVTFARHSQADSCIHPAEEGEMLWQHLDKQATWVWNGLRGGLIVPAVEMEVTGVNKTSFLELWKSRGADMKLILEDNYMAYELAGYYAFSVNQDETIKKQLRGKVKFLVDDAPALGISINPNAAIKEYKLSEMLKKNETGHTHSVKPLVYCGKNLARSPVVEIGFGEGKGRLILSQLITSGRLAEGYGQPGAYGIRYDPAAEQFVINLLRRLSEE